MRQPQRLKEGGVIRKGRGHALFINVQPRKEVELRGYNPKSGVSRCQCRFLLNVDALHAPLILELRPDIQHTCLQPWAEISERLRRY